MYQARRCGADGNFDGGLEQLDQMLGEVWGNDAAKWFGCTRVVAVELFYRGNDRILCFRRDIITYGNQIVRAGEVLTGIAKFAVGDATPNGFPVSAIGNYDR